jgi:hypothetical protein
MATASAGKINIAPSAFRLWRLHSQSRARLFDGTLDLKVRSIKINVAPLKRE